MMGMIDYIVSRENYKFVAVEIQVRNIGKRTLSGDIYDPIAVTYTYIETDTGKQYENTDYMYQAGHYGPKTQPVIPVKWNNYKTYIKRIEPDETKKLYIFYQIPEDQEPVKLYMKLRIIKTIYTIIIDLR